MCVLILHIRAVCQAAVSLHKRRLFNKPLALPLSVSPHTLISHSVLKCLTFPVHSCLIVCVLRSSLSSFLQLCVLKPLSYCSVFAERSFMQSVAVLLPLYFPPSLILHSFRLSLTCLLSKDEDIFSLLAALEHPVLCFSSSRLSLTPLMFVFLIIFTPNLF